MTSPISDKVRTDRAADRMPGCHASCRVDNPGRLENGDRVWVPHASSPTLRGFGLGFRIGRTHGACRPVRDASLVHVGAVGRFWDRPCAARRPQWKPPLCCLSPADHQRITEHRFTVDATKEPRDVDRGQPACRSRSRLRRGPDGFVQHWGGRPLEASRSLALVAAGAIGVPASVRMIIESFRQVSDDPTARFLVGTIGALTTIVWVWACAPDLQFDALYAKAWLPSVWASTGSTRLLTDHPVLGTVGTDLHFRSQGTCSVESTPDSSFRPFVASSSCCALGGS